MKAKKYISADAAKRSSRGAAAVFATVMYTLFTAAVCLQCFFDGFPSNPTSYIIPAVLVLNVLSMWLVIFSRKKLGLRTVGTIQIISLVVLVAVTAGVSEVFASVFLNTDSLVGRYIDVSVLLNFNLAGMIFLLVCCLAAILYCCSVLGYVSAASRAQDGKHAIASGRLLCVLSFILGIVFTAFIPVYLFAETLGAAVGIDTSLLGLKNVSFDFAAYSVPDYAALAAVVAIPTFYFTVSTVAGKMARSKAFKSESTEVQDAEIQDTESQPTEAVFIYDNDATVEAVTEPVTEPVAENDTVIEPVPAPDVEPVPDTVIEIEDEPVGTCVAEPVVLPIAAPVIEDTVIEEIEPSAELVKEPVTEPTVPPTSAVPPVSYIRGTKLIDFGYCENDII